ncbi:MAG TPA: tetratricopeptide repeat protein [Candidatus Gastranaerophilales bacterium]|nr:tetratricopeptide repeat protein [Candidatus Gastranaerophilales bacterium]
MELKYYGAAINEFRLAIMLNPESEASATFYNNLGKAYYKIGDYDHAEASFQKAAQLKPYYIEYCENLIMVCKEKNTLYILAKKYEQLIKNNGNNLQALLMLGLINKKYGNNKYALDFFRKFIFLAPDLRISGEVKTFIKELEK